MQRSNRPYLSKVWVPKARIKAPGVVPALFNLIREAGGFTGAEVRGGWLSPTGEYIEEDIRVHEFVYGDAEWGVEPAVYHLAQALLDAGEQVVLVEINGRRVLLS